MLDKIDLNQTVDKKAYKKEKAELQEKLASLQQSVKDLGIPIIIAFEGWSSAGKGTCISRIVYPLDPRNFNVYTMDKVNEDIVMRPFLHAYWVKTPAKGRIAIFDKSWHRQVLPKSAAKWKLTESEKGGFYYDVNAFERQLHDDGNLIIKIFLHISKDEQKKRFRELEKNPDTRWRVDQSDWKQNRDYEKNLQLFQEMIHQTNSGDCQWSIVEANQSQYATLKIYKIIINKIEDEINRRKAIQANGTPKSKYTPRDISILSSIRLDQTITDAKYKEKLNDYQSKMADLGYKLYTKRRPVIIVFEGWDAAGKGGNIKRLTEQLDPRGYEVVPIAAPSQDELKHHYFWRFCSKFPKDGHLAIFDRSWYGRVMVERIEGYCAEDEWQRAYKEINDMERHLFNHGAIIFKFWLQIDKDVQLARFQARQSDPLKQYKITDEDWRNREKWDSYEEAVDEMLFRTNTDYAPWTIVESSNKKFARIKVLEQVVHNLDKKLK